MREPRVIALAGVFQATQQVRALATGARTDADAVATSLASIFRIDADSAADVFGGVAGVRHGLHLVIAQIDSPQRDLVLTRLVLGVLKLERQLHGQRPMNEALASGIEAIRRQAVQVETGLLDATGSAVQKRLAELYCATLSTLRPRLVVHGDPAYLTRPERVERIRALLLAAVRAAVLWRQVGGRRWRLLLRRRDYAMLARGLLTSSTLMNRD
jgi:high frequency lysogenization protein